MLRYYVASATKRRRPVPRSRSQLTQFGSLLGLVSFGTENKAAVFWYSSIRWFDLESISREVRFVFRRVLKGVEVSYLAVNIKYKFPLYNRGLDGIIFFPCRLKLGAGVILTRPERLIL